MATWLKSANFDGYDGANFYIALYYDILSQSSVTNKSTVRYYLYVGSGNDYWAQGSNSIGYIGDSAVGSINYIAVNDYKLVGYRDITYNHNEDGTSPTISYWASLNTNWGGVGSASLNGTFTLPAIDRYAIITQATNFTDESYPTLTMTNVGLYPLKARMLVGSTVIYNKDIDDQTITSYAYGLTSTERNQLRQLCTGQTLSVKLEIVSIDGSSSYTSSTNVTMSMVNAEPDFSYTTQELNSKVISLVGGSTAQTLIDNVSQVRFTFTPETFKYASVRSANVTNDEKIYSKTTSPYQVDVPVTANYFRLTLTDSRLYSTTKETTRTLLTYYPLKINSFSFKRENPTSSNVIVNAEILYYNTIGTYNNTPYVKWKLDDGSYTTIPSSSYTIDATNHKLTITNYKITNVLDYRNQGQFTLYVEDKLTTTQDAGANGLVLKGIPTFDSGEHDFQVNGDLIVADINRENPVNILETINGLKGTILWENPNPSQSTFDASNITLNSNDYDCYEIICVWNSNTSRTQSTGKLLKGYGGVCNFVSSHSYYRIFEYLSDTTISVADAVDYTIYPVSSQTDNSWFIPLYVIGYKTNMFD